MKKDYLKRLRDLLDFYQMEENEKQDIINDYDDMYEGYRQKGVDDEDIEEKLGSPRSIIGQLTDGYKRASKPQSKSSKVIALTPFISLIVFMILGVGYSYWEYAWMSFLLIPVTAIILEMGKAKDLNVLTALSPFAVSVVYFVLGMEYSLWHPGWLVFLFIPVIAILVNSKELKLFELLTALSPFAAVTAFIFLGEAGLWVPGWVVFMIIPVLGALNEKVLYKLVILELLLGVGIIGYLYIGYTYTDAWNYALLAFIPIIIYAIINRNIVIYRNDFSEKIPMGYQITIAITIITYIVLSLLTQAWVITWLILLVIPVYAIQRETKNQERIIALSPFVAVALFMLIGYYGNVWEWAWLVFLIIPMTAIIKSN